MALRRFAQENRAIGSPRSPKERLPGSPQTGFPIPPSTPKPRLSYGIHRSPADSPSISSSVPFDWEAARSRAPPPYASPLRSRKSMGTSTDAQTTTRKAVIRRKSMFERIKSIPSTIAFEIALFPHNVPLPTPKSSARIFGGAIHFIHFLILANRDSEQGWDRLSGRESSWVDWTTPITLMLILSSLVNTYYMCTRTRNYQFLRPTGPISSPSAKYVVTTLDLEPLERPTPGQRMRASLWYALCFAWRFLFGLQPPKRPAPIKEKTKRIQEMNIWDPNEFELELFSIYSPAQSLLWLAMASSNWLLSVLIMGVVGFQLNMLTHSYTNQVRDRHILARETMQEYNDIFVTPRLNPIRKDVAVMTHQSEVVNVWED